MNRDIVDLALFCVQQDGAAVPTCEINRVVAGIENWRCAHKGAFSWSRDKPKAGFTVSGHRKSPWFTGGSAIGLSAADAWRRAVVGGARTVRL